MSSLAPQLKRAGFPPTQWGVVRLAGRGRSVQAGQALAEVCQAYWYPLYAYARRLGYSPGDAQDLTQGFFEHLLAGRLLASADPARGRFRSFLLRCFRNFLCGQQLRSSCQKRGGGQTLYSLDAAGAEARWGVELADLRSPELICERAWARAVLDQAMWRAQREFAGSGRGRLFQLLKPHLQGDENALSHADLAAKLGTSPETVRVMVHRLRRRYRRLVLEALQSSDTTPAELQEELRYLRQLVER